jgi:hypothetical protein
LRRNPFICIADSGKKKGRFVVPVQKRFQNPSLRRVAAAMLVDYILLARK